MFLLICFLPLLFVSVHPPLPCSPLGMVSSKAGLFPVEVYLIKSVVSRQLFRFNCFFFIINFSAQCECSIFHCSLALLGFSLKMFQPAGMDSFFGIAGIFSKLID